jgi:lipopolysaccharide export system protein LptA
MDMYAKKAIFSKEDNLIELFNDVKIIRNNETIIGDYAKINTLDRSYKIISKNSKRVKLLIESNNEQN